MDDSATALVLVELQDKLAELDAKAAAYQRELRAEFRRFMEDRLKQLTEQVAAGVARVIDESMATGYPSLNPPGPASGLASPSPAPSPTCDRNTWEGRVKSPPPVLYHTSGTPKVAPRSPRDREVEFRGLFTPNFLPLLESQDHALQSPPISPSPLTPSFSPSPDATVVAEGPKEQAEEKAPTIDTRPAPIRRLTERSSSADSSASEASKVRRSALRRSSSSNRGSPRRVRFEFQGVQVLPSSSPQASMIRAPAEEALAQPVADTSAVIMEDESPAYDASTFLDFEHEDRLPKPRKVSSTQALRALSRNPLDAGTQWTVVNADPEESQDRTKTGNETHAAPKADASTWSIMPAIPNETVPLPEADMDEEMMKQEDEDASDDEEYLSIRSKTIKKSPSPAVQSPLTRSRASSPAPQEVRKTTEKNSALDNTTPALPTQDLPESAPGETEDDDTGDLFDFEEAEQPSSTPGPQQPEKYIVDDEEDVDDIDNVGVDPVKELHSTSLPKPLSVSPAKPPTPSTSLFANAAGSYKGAPITAMNPIKDPQLYDEIASMKDVHFFVGSVDGRSGVEAADMGSYRATIGAVVSSTPRSLSERLALDEAMESMKGKSDEAEL